MNKFDLVIVGDGMISLVCALLLSEKKKLKIAIVGNNHLSASKAAGAMHAVYGEIESNFFSSKIEKEYFQIGKLSKKKWIKIIKKYKLISSVNSKNTILYKLNSKNNFEEKNFLTALKLTKKENLIKEISEKEKEKIFRGKINFKNFDAIYIKSEFAFNPIKVITKIKKILSARKVIFIKQKVKNIHYEKDLFIIDKNIKSEKVIVAAGYGSDKVVSKIFNPVPLVKGVGTAFLLKHKYFSKNLKNTIRTSNRGGAQCGLHVVPYDKNTVYVGAGNYLSRILNPLSRTETIKYLLRVLEDEIIPQKIIYESEIIPLLGYRPRSIDNIPSIGSLTKNKNIFYISGTNRVGITWASEIANQVVNWLNKKEINSLFKEFKPDRKIKSWGSIEEANNYYAESRLANLIEHSLIDFNNQKIINLKFEELKKVSKKQNYKIVNKFKLEKNFVVDPDTYKVWI